MRDHINTFVNQGILVPKKTPVNTPLYPVDKPEKPGQFHLVHDLWTVNKIIQEDAPLIPNPHSILEEIPPDVFWFSVISKELCISATASYLFHLSIEGCIVYLRKIKLC